MGGSSSKKAAPKIDPKLIGLKPTSPVVSSPVSFTSYPSRVTLNQQSTTPASPVVSPSVSSTLYPPKVTSTSPVVSSSVSTTLYPSRVIPSVQSATPTSSVVSSSVSSNLYPSRVISNHQSPTPTSPNVSSPVKYISQSLKVSSSLSSSSTSSINVVAKSQTTTTQSSLSKPSVPRKAVNSTPVAPAVVGDQLVKHSVSDYLIPKSVSQHAYPISVPQGKPVDKFCLYVCAKYNSQEGCHAVICRRFHICYFYLQGKCVRDSCLYDHDFNASHNSVIVDAMCMRRNFNTNVLNEVLINNHQYNRRTKRKGELQICMFSILNKCSQKNSCTLVHATKSFVWEVKNENGNWLKLAYNQSNALEELYCQPEQEEVALLPTPNKKPLQKLIELLKVGSDWKVDFLNMKLHSGCMKFDIRRLSTPSDICCLKSMNRLATRWLWYWQDDSGLWNPYINGCGSKFFIVGLSDKLEHHYNFADSDEFEVIIENFTYSINVAHMKQVNKSTWKERNIRRRPAMRELKQEDIYFDRFFPGLQEETIRHKVVSSSSEFSFLKNLMELSMRTVVLLSVERVLNKGLWNTYQNRKRYMKNMLYKDNPSLTNEQYLFHGTNHSSVDLICKENFDWRLYGDNVGNLFGQGVYFSNLASLSCRYGDSNSSGVRVMFVALVLVGTMAIGDSDTIYPPKNAKTGGNFDTTCNDTVDSKVFVKYNRDEYYPAYVLFYRM